MVNSFTYFFHQCAGADLTVLHDPDCRTDHSKFVGVGAAVFFTALFAWISASFALYYVFQSYWVLLIGLVWALFIFSLDRYIVSTIRKGKGFAAALQSAAPRLLIAVFLAMVVSKPLELRIFQQEIDNKLHDVDQVERKSLEDNIRLRYKEARKQYVSRLDQLTKELNDLRVRSDNQALRAIQELNGTGGSSHYGNGPAYRREETAAQQLNKEFTELDKQSSPLIDKLQETLSGLDRRMEDEISKELSKRHSPDGLLARIDALGLLTQKDTMKWGSRAIMFLFIVIEIAPVLVKVLTPEGPYDVKLDSIEKKVKAREIEAVSQLNEEVNRNIQIYLGENEQAVHTQLQGNQALLAQINEAQLEIAQVMIDQWKNGELDKLRKQADQAAIPTLPANLALLG
ncbi:DUF4407 domain-containing protein [Hymenobacter sp. BT635]|uniref:DUF4407 domain-containing protein n=1 Tax=Hymenobacter nitidus TaxID=2880929 RepID=A0ABS8AN92_9BACT|nr:DUF4407 domain-containing protein [Hymenobacter nitidus]MCB2380454.1 DUF4407 domain-containing protein [Hymenobacter nitidus]